MYQALYRKWRPLTFDDVYGQEHITTTLKNQVAAGRVSHAYLFTGTRGTGKTTCAKILARAVNCEAPVNGNPCNACPTCLGISDGSIMDVLELDAASNTGVDNMRSILEETTYPPANAKRRVYIIDEVHMLSAGAFNALLKTLEEPPEYVMFILATTELHRVAPTIMSRCQRFDFRRIAPAEIAANLSKVCEGESIPITPKALELLSRFADGSLRDAQSLLERCVNQSPDGRIDEDAVNSALGISSADSLTALAAAIAAQDAAAALTLLDKLYMEGRDVRAILESLASFCRDILLSLTAADKAALLISPGADRTAISSLAEVFTPRRLLDVSRELQSTINSMQAGGGLRLDAELCLIKLCTPGVSLEDGEDFEGRIAALETRIASGIVARPQAAAAPAEPQKTEPPKPEKKPAKPDKPAAPQKNELDDKKRTAFLAEAGRTLSALYRPFIMDARFFLEGEVITVVTDEDFKCSMLNRDETRTAIAAAATKLWGGEWRVSVSTKIPEPKGGFDGFDDIINEGREAGITIDID